MSRKKVRYWYFFPAFIFFLSGCTQKTVFTPVNINGQYTVRLPSYLEPSTQLSKEASLQYQNTEKEFYCLVIDENKSELKKYNLNYTLKSYFDSAKKELLNRGLTDVFVAKSEEKHIDSCNVLIADILGKVGNEDVCYKFAVIETPHNYYQFIFWTLKEYKKKYEVDMDSVLYSFKELPLN